MVASPVPGASLPHATYKVLFEDPALLVVDKGHGLLTVPGIGPEKADCLLSRLRADGYAEVEHAPHRLDRDTSGIVVLGRTPAAHRSLAYQFQERLASKLYEALVLGWPDADFGEVDAPIGKAPGADGGHARMRILPDGRPSVTRWEVAAALPSGRCRVRLAPETGRRHQLRMHMLALGCPLVGDALYGQAGSGRMHLHAAELSFDHPTTGERVTFSSEPPFALADDDAAPPPPHPPRVPTLRALCESQLASTFAALRDVEADVAAQRSELSARKDALLVELGEVSESLEALYVSHANLRATREGRGDGVRDALGAAAEEVLRRVEPPD